MLLNEMDNEVLLNRLLELSELLGMELNPDGVLEKDYFATKKEVLSRMSNADN